MRYLLKGGDVINPAGKGGRLDIIVDNGIIERMGEGLSDDNATTIYANGLKVMPGLIDMHCHLREPGYEYKEDILSGTKAAAMGGFTGVACMPNTDPICDNEGTVEYIIAKAEQAGYARVYPVAAITKGQKGKELSEMGFLLQAGAVAFSDDGVPVESAGVMRNALLYAKGFDALLLSHCEDFSLVNGGYMNEGDNSTAIGMRGNSRAAEEVMIARELIIAEAYDARIHICHVTTELGFEMIRQAKARGVSATCETCPHYFTLTDDACLDFDTNAKVNPPLRTHRDREAVIKAIADGTVDAIVTDHAPHHEDEKKVEFALAANGISGFETAVSLAWQKLVQPGHIDADKLVQLMAVQPAAMLKVQGGRLEEGSPADISLFDPDMKWVVSEEGMYSKGKNTPFMGTEMTGKMKHVFIEGRLVVDGYRVVEKQL